MNERPHSKYRVLGRLIFVAVLAVLGLMLATSGGKLEKPRIQNTLPEQVSRNYLIRENRLITLYGSGFTEESKLYINGKPNNVEYTLGDIHITFFADDSILDGEEFTIQVLNGESNWSNLYTVPILDGSALGEPDVDNATFEALDDYSAVLHVEGKRFNDTTAIYLSDEKQSQVTVLDENHIEVKLTDETLLMKTYVNVQAENYGDEALRSASIRIAIPTQLDMTKRPENNVDYLRQGNLIAHAFGAHDGAVYTNSVEAFEANYAKGHRLFEADVQLANDGELMVMHDRRGLYGSAAEEKDRVAYTMMSADELCALLVQYPNAYIITDSKYSGLQATHEVFDKLEKAAKRAGPDVLSRIVPQVYSPPMYHYLVNHFDYQSYIFTLYNSEMDDDEVLEFARSSGIRVVTMPASRASRNLIARLSDLGVFSFVHTVNDAAEASEMMRLGAYGLYTDTLTNEAIGTDPAAYYETFVVAKGYRQDKAMAEQNLLGYLEGLENSDYITLLAVNQDASTAATPAVRQKLVSMGVDPELFESYGYYYVAVFEGGRVVHQELSAGAVQYRAQLGSWQVSMSSSMVDTVYRASIVIDGVEEAPNLPGLNLAVLDRRLGRLADAVSFDTTRGLAMLRWATDIGEVAEEPAEEEAVLDEAPAEAATPPEEEAPAGEGTEAQAG